MTSRWTLTACSLLLCGFGLGSSAAFADTCADLVVAEVDKAFPQQAPWEDRSYIGACRFVSPVGALRPANTLRLEAKIMRSAGDAEQWVRVRRETRDCVPEPPPESGLGAAAYLCRPQSGSESDGHAIYLIAHGGRVVISGSLLLDKSMAGAGVQALIRFTRAALKLSADGTRIENHWKCPWLHTATVEKLLPGPGYGQRGLAYEACIAQSLGGTLTVVTGDAEDAADLAPSFGRGCQDEPLTKLGEFAGISYACADWPRAELYLIAGKHVVKYTLDVEREPTVAERALLVELGRQVQAELGPPHAK